MRRLFMPLFVGLVLTSCAGEDRSGEQPFAPTVATVSAEAVAPGTCQMMGRVLASPNSTLQVCGFQFGNAIDQKTLNAEVANMFSVTQTDLAAGRYYVVAFARNRVDISYGDTLWVEVE